MTRNDDPPAAAQGPDPARRSRWRRFSPSMGWAAFWSEIVIVVLGVAIALAANEAVQEWSWRKKVEDAEVRLQGDVTLTFLWAAEKYATGPCVDAQLERLERNVLESGPTLEPVPVRSFANVRYIVRIPSRPYRFPVWDALVANGTATHLPPDRQAFLGNLSDAMAQARLSEAVTRRLMGRLLVMGHPIELDPGVRADLLAQISELRSHTTFEVLAAQQRMRSTIKAGSAPADPVVEAFLEGPRTNGPATGFSSAVEACRAQGLPVADWRDLEVATAADRTDPRQGVGK
jgi:hypothetical protein